MKFESRKDVLFSSMILGLIILISVVTTLNLMEGALGTEDYLGLSLVLITVLFLLWIFFGTNYELSDEGFIYRCGPINGKIAIHRIRGIVKGKTSWVGFRPATARNGLIIKYDEYSEIYISPETNDSFIEKILELKGDIEIKK